MIRTRTPSGRHPAEITRHECVSCGEHLDTIRLTAADVVDHHCPRAGGQAWWIVRRGVASP